MSFDIRFSDAFRRSVKALAKKYPSIKQDLTDLVTELEEKPDLGIPLSSNLFKVRMNISSKSRGKSGGARVITCVVYKREQVLLAEIYDKSDYSTVDERIIIKNLQAEGFDI